MSATSTRDLTRTLRTDTDQREKPTPVFLRDVGRPAA